ncbi:DNA alkylation repair protein [Roseburia hominis]
MNQLVEEIKKELIGLVDTKYRDFHSGLLPGVENIMGVRIPELRKLARKIARQDWRAYLAEAACDTYEEIMIQGMVIGYAKMEMEERIRYLDAFAPKIDNWAVCDCCTSTYKFMGQNQEEWFSYCMKQIAIGTEFSVRFGAVSLMDYFINEKWIDQVLSVYDEIHHEGYYVKMAVAWGISMCYVKFPEKTWKFLEGNHLDTFTQNKAIQKIRESYRVPKEEKEELKRLRR